MAQHFNLDAYLHRLTNSTYEQLEDEMVYWTHQSNHTAEVLHNVQLDYEVDMEALGDISIQADIAVNRHLIIMLQPDHLDQLDPELHIQEQQLYNQLLRQQDHIRDEILHRVVEHHHDCRLLTDRLREINFLSSLITLAHLIKVDRQDLV